MLIRARLRGSGPEQDATILNASSRGLLVMAADPPEAGHFVELIVGNHSLVGHVKWASARRFGVTLRERISVFALLSGDSGPITVKERAKERRRKSRIASGGFGIARKIEYAVLFASAAAGTLIVAGSANTALQSLVTVKQALSGQQEP